MVAARYQAEYRKHGLDRARARAGAIGSLNSTLRVEFVHRHHFALTQGLAEIATWIADCYDVELRHCANDGLPPVRSSTTGSLELPRLLHRVRLIYRCPMFIFSPLTKARGTVKIGVGRGIEHQDHRPPHCHQVKHPAEGEGEGHDVGVGEELTDRIPVH